jgi:hypothetical protein
LRLKPERRRRRRRREQLSAARFALLSFQFSSTQLKLLLLLRPDCCKILAL